MKVSSRQVMDVVCNGTGRQPEAVVLLLVRAVAEEAAVAALHMADLVSQYRTPTRARS